MPSRAPGRRSRTRTRARCSSRRRTGGSSPTSAAGITSAVAPTARSRPRTPRCRCSPSGSTPRFGASSTSCRSRSSTSAWSRRHTRDGWPSVLPDARQLMVEHQLRRRGIHDQRVLEAMGRVPRELFVPEEHRAQAYADGALPIGHGATISQPYMVAAICELLSLTGREQVLDVGTGSGYQAAVLAELAGEVVTIERVPALAELAGRALAAAGYDRVDVRVGDGTLGVPDRAPF